MLENEQTLISQKKTTNTFSVNRRFVNSKQFRDKFELLPLRRETKSLVYKEVGRLLEFVDGQDKEYLVALDFYTGRRIVDNFAREAEVHRTSFSKEEWNKIKDANTDIICIHNHSYNGEPSAKDLKTYHNRDEIKLSIIACHDGDLYAIFDVKDEMVVAYDSILEEVKARVSDIDIAKTIATQRLYERNKVFSSKKKMFDVRRL